MHLGAKQLLQYYAPHFNNGDFMNTRLAANRPTNPPNYIYLHVGLLSSCPVYKETAKLERLHIFAQSFSPSGFEEKLPREVRSRGRFERPQNDGLIQRVAWHKCPVVEH